MKTTLESIFSHEKGEKSQKLNALQVQPKNAEAADTLQNARKNAEATNASQAKTEVYAVQGKGGYVFHRRTHKYWRMSYLAAFLLPFLAYYILFFLHGLFPVGNGCMTTVDAYAQYIPFLTELRHCLLNRDFLFLHSWHYGLGGNFYVLWAYYLASPFNLIVLFFPRDMIPEALFMIIALKIGTMGLTCNIALTKIFGEREVGIFRIGKKGFSAASLLRLAFSSFYALSTYVISYSWSIMWLDGLVMLPLIVLGAFEFMTSGKKRLYVISFALSIIFNYYTAFFNGVFMIMFVFVLLFMYAPQGARQKFFKMLKFAVLNLLAVLASLVVLLPVYLNTINIPGGQQSWPERGSFFIEVPKGLYRMLLMQFPNIYLDYFPNIYVGLLPVMCFVAFMFMRKVDIRARLATLFIFLFFMASFHYAPLDFLMNGRHYAMGMQYRYSFTFVFLLVFVGYYVVLHLPKAPFCAYAGGAFVIIVLTVMQALDKKEQLPEINRLRIILTILWLAAYLTVIALYVHKRYAQEKFGRKRTKAEIQISDIFAKATVSDSEAISNKVSAPTGAFGAEMTPGALGNTAENAAENGRSKFKVTAAWLLLAVFMFADLCFSSFWQVKKYNEWFPLTDRNTYAQSGEYKSYRAISDHANSINENMFYRMNIHRIGMSNMGTEFGFNSAEAFSSTMYAKSAALITLLGYTNNGYITAYFYNEPNYYLDTILGIRYLVKPTQWPLREHRRYPLLNHGEYTMYENNDAFRFGFFLPEDKYDSTYNSAEVSYDPYGNINEFNRRALGGSAEDIYTPVGFQVDETQGVSLTKNGEGNGEFSFKNPEGADSWCFVKTVVPEAGSYAVSWDGPIDSINGYVHNGAFFEASSPERAKVLGYFEAGELIEMRLHTGSNTEGVIKANLYKFNEQAFQESYNNFAKAPLQIEGYNSRMIKASVNAPQNGYLFLPVLHQPGYSYKIDGEAVKPEIIKDTFPLVRVPQGNHKVKITFTPPGYFAGITISLLTVLLCLAYSALKKMFTDRYIVIMKRDKAC